MLVLERTIDIIWSLREIGTRLRSSATADFQCDHISQCFLSDVYTMLFVVCFVESGYGAF